MGDAWMMVFPSEKKRKKAKEASTHPATAARKVPFSVNDKAYSARFELNGGKPPLEFQMAAGEGSEEMGEPLTVSSPLRCRRRQAGLGTNEVRTTKSHHPSDLGGATNDGDGGGGSPAPASLQGGSDADENDALPPPQETHQGENAQQSQSTMKSPPGSPQGGGGPRKDDDRRRHCAEFAATLQQRSNGNSCAPSPLDMGSVSAKVDVLMEGNSPVCRHRRSISSASWGDRHRTADCESKSDNIHKKKKKETRAVDMVTILERCQRLHGL